MIGWLLKKIYASVEIQNGEVINCFHKIPRSFILDLKDLLENEDSISGILYIKMKNNLPHIHFKGEFNTALQQRIRNCWGIHRDRYK